MDVLLKSHRHYYLIGTFMFIQSCGVGSASPPFHSVDEGAYFAWGQSNIQQQALASTLTGPLSKYAPVNQSVAYNLKQYASAAHTSPTTIAWESLQTVAVPLHNGFEMAFGFNIGGGQALSKFSVAGSNLDQWIAGSWFDEAAAYYAARIADRGTAQYNAAIIMCQGESETPTTVVNWKANATAGTAILRATLGAIPVIMIRTYVGLGPPGLRAQQDAFAADVADVHVVNTDDLPPEAPPHWLNPSICTIGERVAAVAASIVVAP